MLEEEVRKLFSTDGRVAWNKHHELRKAVHERSDGIVAPIASGKMGNQIHGYLLEHTRRWLKRLQETLRHLGRNLRSLTNRTFPAETLCIHPHGFPIKTLGQQFDKLCPSNMTTQSRTMQLGQDITTQLIVPWYDKCQLPIRSTITPNQILLVHIIMLTSLCMRDNQLPIARCIGLLSRTNPLKKIRLRRRNRTQLHRLQVWST